MKRITLFISLFAIALVALLFSQSKASTAWSGGTLFNRHSELDVSVTAVAGKISATDLVVNGATIYNDSTNSATIYIGPSSAASLYPIGPGQWFCIQGTPVNLSEWYLVSSSSVTARIDNW